MLRLSDSRNFARTLCGLSLIATPLLLLVGVLLGPDLSDDAAERLVEIEEDKSLFAASAVLFLVAPWVFIPGMVGLIHLLRSRSVNIGQVAAALLLLGALATTVFYGVSGYEYQAATAGFDTPRVADLMDAVDDSDFFIPIFVVFLVGVVLGGIVLGISLWRRGVVPIWAGLAISVSALVGFIADSKAVSAIGFALLLVGLGATGLRVLSMSDEEWERWTPLPDRTAPPTDSKSTI
jgi:hypothetical protein